MFLDFSCIILSKSHFSYNITQDLSGRIRARVSSVAITILVTAQTSYLRLFNPYLETCHGFQRFFSFVCCPFSIPCMLTTFDSQNLIDLQVKLGDTGRRGIFSLCPFLKEAKGARSAKVPLKERLLLCALQRFRYRRLD